MKKLFLTAAVLVGAISASRAGVNFNLGIGIPFPPPLVVVSHRAPVYTTAPVCAPPVCETRVVESCPPVVYRERYEFRRHGYHHHERYVVRDRDYDRDDRDRRDHDDYRHSYGYRR